MRDGRDNASSNLPGGFLIRLLSMTWTLELSYLYLDEENIKVIKEMLAQLKDMGKTIIISEHRIFYLMDIIDRIFLIKNGEIQREYTKIDFMKLFEQSGSYVS